MADSASLRTIRWKRHKAGDHSLCRRCAAVRDEPAPSGAVADPVAELRELAGMLMADYRASRGNAILARELRATLLALPEAEQVGDVLGELRAVAAKVS